MLRKKDERFLEEQLNKLNHLTENGIRQISLQSDFFDAIDKKILWSFTLISATQYYIFDKYLLKVENFTNCNSFLLYGILLFGILLQLVFLFDFSLKRFEIGPGIEKQIKFGKKDKTFFELKLDTVVALKKSIISNKNVLNKKSKRFGYVLFGIYIYYVFTILFLLIINIYD